MNYTRKSLFTAIPSDIYHENTKILLLFIGCGTVKVVGYDAQVAEQLSATVWAGSGLATAEQDQ